MKFGKLLEEYQLPEWKTQYLKYNPLKKSLYDIKSELDNPKSQDGPAGASGGKQTSWSNFTGLGIKSAPPNDVMAAIADLQYTREPIQEWKQITEAEIIRIGSFVDAHFEDLSKQFHGLCEIGIDAQSGDATRKAALGHFPELRMLQALNRVSEAVGRLRGFAELNHAALYKLMKKFDKVLKQHDGLKLEYARLVTETGLTNFSRFESLDADIKREFERTSRYQGLEGSAEVARLCAGLGSPGTTMGGHQVNSRFERLLFFFLGSSSALFISILVLITLPPRHPGTYSNAYFMSSFCVFQFIFSIFLIIWGMGAAAQTCDVNFINHMFLLDVDPRCKVGPSWLFSAAAGLTSLWILIFGMYVVDYKWNIFPSYADTTDDGYNSRSSWHFVLYPIAVLFLSVGLMFAPSRICRYRYKKALARSAKRTALAPFYPVTFGDNIVGDVMTSLAKPLQDIPASLCYLFAHHPQPKTTVDRFVMNGDACPDWEHHFIIPIIAGLPFWFRLLQCARRYHDTQDLRHLANLGKYAASLLVVLVTHGGPFAASNNVLILVSAVATTYAAVWDVYMDWGLGAKELTLLFQLGADRLTSPNSKGSALVKRQCSEVECRRHFGPLFYWFAVIFDVLARLTWVLTLMPLNILTTNLVYRSVLKTFISSLEILRRSLWVVLRIEHEQVANASGYRARVWVPIRPQMSVDAAPATPKPGCLAQPGEILHSASKPLLS